MRTPGTGAAVPVEIVALDSGGAVLAGLSDIFASVSRASDGLLYDWILGTWSASPANPWITLTEVGDSLNPGLYEVAGGFTPAADDTYTFTVTQIGSPLHVHNVPQLTVYAQGPLVGSATLGSSLVDGLVPVVDEAKALFAEFGARQFRTFLMRSLWSGGFEGIGAKSVTQKLELLPVPDVELGDKHELSEGGTWEVGGAKVSDVSLTYTEADLGFPATATPGESFKYLVVDGTGQGIHTRIYIPGDHPESHRADEKDAAGWILKLVRDDGQNVTA